MKSRAVEEGEKIQRERSEIAEKLIELVTRLQCFAISRTVSTVCTNSWLFGREPHYPSQQELWKHLYASCLIAINVWSGRSCGKDM